MDRQQLYVGDPVCEPQCAFQSDPDGQQPHVEDSGSGDRVIADRVIVSRLAVADSFFTRLRGLLGKKSLASDEGLWLDACHSIHTFFMRFAIDVVFIDADGCVAAVHACVAPGKVVTAKRAVHTIELPAGACERLGLKEGQRVKRGAVSKMG
ncbi:MAG: DUF192 domain-containing protein [Bacilli bacterium]